MNVSVGDLHESIDKNVLILFYGSSDDFECARSVRVDFEILTMNFSHRANIGEEMQNNEWKINRHKRNAKVRRNILLETQTNDDVLSVESPC